MIVFIITLIISFLLEGIMSFYFEMTFTNLSVFTTIYTIINLIIIAPYFQNKKKYYLLCLIFGLLFDISYTNTLFLNMTIFLLIGQLANIIYIYFKNTLVNNAIISFLLICFYHILTFLILTILNYHYLNISLLFKVILHSFINTIIYSILLTLVINFLQKKQDISSIK